MKRSPSLYGGEDDLDRSRHGGNSSPRRSLFPNVNSRAAISAGRALLDRPARNTPFTASAANTALPCLSTEPALKSCLSSSNVLTAPGTDHRPSQNEEFKSFGKRNVSFSHLQVREYDITLGDNPSVSSGLPVSLDWSYDPNERVAPVDAFEAVRVRRNSSELILTDRQRDDLLMRPDITQQDVTAVLQDVAAARLERKMSRNELLEERQRERAKLVSGRSALRARRMSTLQASN
jgi:hypothetical protein